MICHPYPVPPFSYLTIISDHTGSIYVFCISVHIVLPYPHTFCVSVLTSLSICSVCKFIKHHDKSCNPFRPELLKHTPVLPLSAVINYEFFAGRTIMYSVVSKNPVNIQKPSRHTCQLIESIPVKIEIIFRSKYVVAKASFVISYKRTHYRIAKAQTHFLSPDPISLILVLYRPPQKSPYAAVHVSFAIVPILDWSIIHIEYTPINIRSCTI